MKYKIEWQVLLKWIGHIKRIKEVEITQKARSRKLWLDRVDEINKKKGVRFKEQNIACVDMVEARLFARI